MAAITPYSRFLVAQLPPEKQPQVSHWLASRSGSEELVNQLSTKSKTRYHLNVQEAATKAVFEAAFQRAPEGVITAAENAQGTTYYPLWKRVVRVDLFQKIGTVLGNVIVKVALVILAGYFGYTIGYQAYEATRHFFAARAVPYIINNTPIAVIRVFNRAMDCLNAICTHWFRTLCCTWAAQRLILAVTPEIPYFTPAVRAIDVGALFWILVGSPQTIGWFLIGRCIEGINFAGSCCSNVSAFFVDMAEKAESERLQLCKQRAYALWKQDIARA